MRIVLAPGWYFPESLGGTEIYVRGLAALLQAHGHEVRVVAPLAGLVEPQEYLYEGVGVFRYPVPATPTRDEAQSVVAARGVEHLTAFLARFGAEIFHAHSLVTGLGVHELAAARRTGAHVIYTNHLPSMGYICLRGTLLRDGHTPCDGLQEEARCGACLLQQRHVPRAAALAISGLPSAIGRTFARLPGPAGTALGIREVVRQAASRQRMLVDVCDRIVVLNDWARRIFVVNGAPAGKVSINRLGVSHPDLARKPSPGANPTRSPVTVGYLGRLHEVKGLHVLGDAMRRLPASVPLRLEVAGPASDAHSREVLNAFRDATRDDPRVSVSGPVAPEQIGDRLRSFDVLCCPSLWFENGPTIALEAMAVGTPVVGTRLGAFVEIVRDGVNGCLVDPGDAQALVDVLARVATDPQHTIDTWRAAMGSVRTIREIANDYLETYAALVGREVAAG